MSRGQLVYRTGSHEDECPEVSWSIEQGHMRTNAQGSVGSGVLPSHPFVIYNFVGP